MKEIILFDDMGVVNHLKPFTYTRPISEIRVGIQTIREKWETAMQAKASYHSPFHLSGKYPCRFSEVSLLINGSIFPNPKLVQQIKQLPLFHALVEGETLIALKLDELSARQHLGGQILDQIEAVETDLEYKQLSNLWDIFKMNDEEIRKDFDQLTQGRQSQPLSETNQLLGSDNQLFIEEGAVVECSILNTQTGPIYIGKDALVMEGCKIRGPFAMLPHAVTKMDAKIYGATTLGPYCKVGGELNNAVFFGYSNKGHDGFLGNAVIGEWCNLGADTNNSNLKNNYSEVKVWNYEEEDYEGSDLQFCGLFMGDHSKTGINTMLNTGTVVGVAANIFGGGFPPKFVPSFSWGGADGWATYMMDRAIDAAERMMQRRSVELTEDDETILYTVFNQSEKYRFWEHEENETPA
jgi:UDP-N-acetylglucosamine diphosphorylase/glucosamine-1-phosphate N-acetyltransferase